MIKIGEKVTYDDGFTKEHGIVKSMSDDNHCFVVYHWHGESSDYRDYSAERTSNKDLKKGWL
jgi:hypothetical protein